MIIANKHSIIITAHKNREKDVNGAHFATDDATDDGACLETRISHHQLLPYVIMICRVSHILCCILQDYYVVLLSPIELDNTMRMILQVNDPILSGLSTISVLYVRRTLVISIVDTDTGTIHLFIFAIQCSAH